MFDYQSILPVFHKLLSGARGPSFAPFICEQHLQRMECTNLSVINQESADRCDPSIARFITLCNARCGPC